MPIYHFNIADEVRADGTALKDLTEAKCEAVKFAGRAICDAAGEFWDRKEWSLTVTDETGLILFQLDVNGTEAPAALKVSRQLVD